MLYRSDVIDEIIKQAAEKIINEDIIEKAHPEPIYVANARGDGGLVENQNEIREKFMEAVNTFPSATHLGAYANLIARLTKTAEDCDSLGQYKAAKILDKTAETLVGDLESFLAQAPKKG